MMSIKRISITLILISLLLFSIITATLLFDSSENESESNKLYTFPILVSDKTYTVSVRSNFSSIPEVNYFGLLKSVSVNFRGESENTFCNITIPTDLVWGELSVYQHGYEMSESDYIQSSNSTHNSVYFLFDLTALVKDFEIMGTEGVIP